MHTHTVFCRVGSPVFCRSINDVSFLQNGDECNLGSSRIRLQQKTRGAGRPWQHFPFCINQHFLPHLNQLCIKTRGTWLLFFENSVTQFAVPVPAPIYLNGVASWGILT